MPPKKDIESAEQDEAGEKASEAEGTLAKFMKQLGIKRKDKKEWEEKMPEMHEKKDIDGVEGGLKLLYGINFGFAALGTVQTYRNYFTLEVSYANPLADFYDKYTTNYTGAMSALVSLAAAVLGAAAGFARFAKDGDTMRRLGSFYTMLNIALIVFSTLHDVLVIDAIAQKALDPNAIQKKRWSVVLASCLYKSCTFRRICVKHELHNNLSMFKVIVQGIMVAMAGVLLHRKGLTEFSDITKSMKGTHQEANKIAAVEAKRQKLQELMRQQRMERMERDEKRRQRLTNRNGNQTFNEWVKKQYDTVKEKVVPIAKRVGTTVMKAANWIGNVAKKGFGSFLGMFKK